MVGAVLGNLLFLYQEALPLGNAGLALRKFLRDFSGKLGGSARRGCEHLCDSCPPDRSGQRNRSGDPQHGAWKSSRFSLVFLLLSRVQDTENEKNRHKTGETGRY